MKYSDIDYDNHSGTKWSYNYVGYTTDYGIGIAWDMNKSPIFIIERVESVCVDSGCSNPDYFEPPHYEPEGVETIIVRPKLKYPKRNRK
jgi:hypothetical protein